MVQKLASYKSRKSFSISAGYAISFGCRFKVAQSKERHDNGRCSLDFKNEGLVYLGLNYAQFAILPEYYVEITIKEEVSARPMELVDKRLS